MSILFFTRKFYPDIGGVETHVLEVSRLLVRYGHNVTVISELPINSIGNQKKINEVFEGIKIRRISAGKDDWFKKFRIWKEIIKNINLIRKADTIHCHDVFFWYFPFKFIFPKKKVFTTFHGYEGKYPPRKSAIIVRRISEILSNGNICVGDYIRQWYGANPDYVIYGGVKTDQKSNLKNQIYNSILKIVLVGRLEKDIGVSTYLKALEILKSKNSGFEFSAFGEGKLANRLKKYGKVYRFTDEITERIKESDIVFASSYLLILEALIAKKIVISVYENKLKEDYLRTSPFADFIYICKDAKEVVQVVEYIKNDPWKSESMIEKGYIFAKEQTWDGVCKIYLRLWKV